MSKRAGVIICEIIVHVLVIVQNNNNNRSTVHVLKSRLTDICRRLTVCTCSSIAMVQSSVDP